MGGYTRHLKLTVLLALSASGTGLNASTQMSTSLLRRKPVPIYRSKNFAISYRNRAEPVEVYFNPSTSTSVADLTSSQSQIRYVRSSSESTLLFEQRSGNRRYRFEFLENPSQKKFVLKRITTASAHKYFLMEDAGSFDVADQQVTAPCSIRPAFEQQINFLFDSVSKEKSCDNFAADLDQATAQYRPAINSGSSGVASCIVRFPDYLETGKRLEAFMATKDSKKLVCDLSQPSNFDRDNSIITLGKEVLSGPVADRSKAILHEFLHSVEIRNEVEDNAIVSCCAFPKSAESNCSMLETIESLHPFLKSEKLNSLATLLRNYLLDSSDSDQTRRIAVVKSLVDFMNQAVRTLAKDARSIALRNGDLALVALQKICKEIKDPGCSDGPQSARAEIKNAIEFIASYADHQARQANVDQKMGTASSEQPIEGPITPPKLTYSPDTTDVKSAQAEVEKVRAPLMAARHYASSVASTFFAGMGATANAAIPSLPQQISKDEWSTTVSNVDPKTGDITLNLGTDDQGQPITGSASIPFSGTSFGQPQVVIEHGDRKIVSADGTSITVPSTSSSTDTRPQRILKPGQVVRGSAPSLSDDANQGGGGRGDAGLIESSSAPSRGSVSLASGSATATSRAITTSTLKRMFARAQNKTEMINSHLEDLKANSLMVHYGCVWYPKNFVGNYVFDLDALEHRKCASP